LIERGCHYKKGNRKTKLKKSVTEYREKKGFLPAGGKKLTEATYRYTHQLKKGGMALHSNLDVSTQDHENYERFL